MTRQQRRAAERQAAKQGRPGLQAAKQMVRSPEPLKHGTVHQYSFFFSPKDSHDDVLSIVCDDSGRGLPLQVGKMMWEPSYLADQDREAAKDPAFVQDLLDQLEAVRDFVCSQPDKMVNVSDPDPFFADNDGGTLGSTLALMAGNIAWLTSRGHLKQSEYNGTQVVSII
jgi:hypothetical protein